MSQSAERLPPTPALHWTRWATGVVAAITVLTLLRLWLITWHDLVADEAYYWLWSKHLESSYFSKGPGIAWTIAAGTAVFGDTVFGIRWLVVLLAAGTGWQLFWLGRRLFDERTAATAFGLTTLIPLFAVGSILMTIDPLSVFFWVWGANVFLDTLERGGWWRWALLGFVVGCGFLAKYVNVMQFISFWLFLAWSPAYRSRLLDWRWLIAIGMFVLCLIPVLWWNAVHDWPTVKHLAHHVDSGSGVRIKFTEMTEYIGTQASVYSPLLWIGLMAAVIATTLGQVKTTSQRYLLSLFLPVFVMYLCLSLNDSGEANWPVTAYPAAVLLAAQFWPRLLTKDLRWWCFAGPALAAALIQTMLLHETSLLNLPRGWDPVDRLRGAESFGEQINKLRKEHNTPLIIGNKYQTAAHAAFYAEGKPTTYIPNQKDGRILNQFSFWPGYTVEPGTRALYITDQLDAFPKWMQREFSQVEKVADFWTRESGREIRQYHAYLLTAE